ncbi:MAG TPA: low molecular weight protein-tyrosine-phosphatase [Mycobacteriales bacterium]|nr:low molecular weight protein-tyrosine-phosphatase [Mycobacteriales bacterium]
MSFRICFVCLGNICRSPIAEVVMRSLLAKSGLADRVEVSSAGTGDWHIGQGADERALAVLARHGYDGSAHRAQQFLDEAIAEHDLVLAMDKSNLSALRRMAHGDDRDKLRLLREFDPDATDTDVPDPYYGGDDGFDEVLVMVEAACRGLLDHLDAELAG